MDSQALIELAIKHLSCTQKELAHHLGVSPTQISKWKKENTFLLKCRRSLKFY